MRGLLETRPQKVDHPTRAKVGLASAAALQGFTANPLACARFGIASKLSGSRPRGGRPLRLGSR